MRRALIAGLVLIALLLGCGRAAAAPPPGGWGALELHIAQEYWGGATADLGCSSYSIEWDQTLTPDRAGEATMPTGLPRVDCEMRISGGLSPRELCYVVIHEYGHWLGLNHDRGGVMSADPGIMYVQTKIPACLRQPE